MKVAEYHRQGVRHWVAEPPPGYVPLGAEARNKNHRVAFWGQVEAGHLRAVRFTSSRRCRKLLALADVAAERLRGQPYPGYTLDAEAVLAFFAEERDQQKMADRMALIMQALYPPQA